MPLGNVFRLKLDTFTVQQLADMMLSEDRERRRMIAAGEDVADVERELDDMARAIKEKI